jgi:hypothetical protein
VPQVLRLRAMTAHSWGVNDPATAEATINVLLA